jgi:DNA-binding transcriptional LysR family regulator
MEKASLDDMMVFRLVVDSGSFTGAALAMDLPKSNISRKISRLEKQLGVRLLERSTRSLRLTEVGQIYFQHCSRIFEEMQSANQCIEVLSSTPSGKLKICASVSIGQNILAPRLAKFQQLYPEIELDLQLLNRRIDLIEEGFDLAIRVGELEDSALISKRLFDVELHLYASPKYLAASSHILKQPEDLLHHACLYMNANDEILQWQLAAGNKKQAIEIKPSFSSNDFTTLRQLTVDDYGIALLPDYLCQQQVKDKSLVRVLDDWVGRRVKVNAVYPNRKSMTPKLRAMLDYLAE